MVATERERGSGEPWGKGVRPGSLEGPLSFEHLPTVPGKRGVSLRSAWTVTSPHELCPLAVLRPGAGLRLARGTRHLAIQTPSQFLSAPFLLSARVLGEGLFSVPARGPVCGLHASRQFLLVKRPKR